jgi:hypothetical protein
MLVSLLTAWSLFRVNQAECAEKTGAPNIVFILADDKYYLFRLFSQVSG